MRPFALSARNLDHANDAVIPCVGLVAVHTGGKASVEGGAWAFVASSHKVRSDSVGAAAAGPDSSVQRIGIGDLLAYML